MRIFRRTKQNLHDLPRASEPLPPVATDFEPWADHRNTKSRRAEALQKKRRDHDDDEVDEQ
jgi:hypothetical protein